MSQEQNVNARLMNHIQINCSFVIVRSMGKKGVNMFKMSSNYGKKGKAEYKSYRTEH